ncbi:AI-2E family transporter [Tessaracoccus sp. OS52]|uniref:AI-2E family transporter n=1 Tax=Tessaracoccus sp. OS52 TaxID=2886691 RepID=UPI001D126D8D|nr:AI-2E family transporter [Tessaracoccus sp. OS52]MCC2592569.1 AI-2E family transporter [Tessaracoccus sp. OS52]
MTQNPQPPQATGVAPAEPPLPDEAAVVQDGNPTAGAALPVSRMSRLGRVAIVLGAMALTLTLFHEYSAIIAPVFLGINLLVTAFPVFTWLTGQGVPRWLGALATGLTVFLVLIAGVGAIVWSVTSMVTSLGDYSSDFTAMYQATIDFLAQLGFDREALLAQLRSISPSSVLGLLGDVASAGSSVTGMVAVVVVALVFMVMDLPSIHARFGITHHLHPQFTAGLESFVVGIRRYWLVTTLFGLIVAALDGLVLVVLGIPLPLVWAMLSFITNYIPNVGFIIGLVPPALLALFERGPVTALVVVIAYSVLNFVIQSIIQPKYTGESVGITPTMSFLSLLLWTAVFGALGALLALPFTLMIKAMLIDNDPKLRWLNAIIAANPQTAVPDGGRVLDREPVLEAPPD